MVECTLGLKRSHATAERERLEKIDLVSVRARMPVDMPGIRQRHPWTRRRPRHAAAPPPAPRIIMHIPASNVIGFPYITQFRALVHDQETPYLYI